LITPIFQGFLWGFNHDTRRQQPYISWLQAELCVQTILQRQYPELPLLLPELKSSYAEWALCNYRRH